MALEGPVSYLPTMDEFIAHWAAVDAALGAEGPLVLRGGMGLAELVALREKLAEQRAEVERARNSREWARAEIEGRKAALLARLNQFNGKLASEAPGTRWARRLPKAFSITEGMGRVLPPLEEQAALWQRYEAENPAIVLMGGYGRAAHAAELAALKAAYQAYSAAEVDLGLARGARDETQARVRPVLRRYRQRVPSEFAEGSALLATLPRLTPPRGSTPDAVELSGSYDEAGGEVHLTWTEVEDKRVARLELRATAGPEYDPKDETRLGSFPPEGPREWRGTFGVDAPGAAVSFKLYSLTEEGNERGSKAVTVARPP